MSAGDRILHQPLITPRIRELAILAVTATHPTGFVEYSHRGICQTLESSFSPEQTEALCNGITPSGLTEVEQTAHEAALVMARGVGTMTDEQFATAKAKLSKEMLARIAQLVGFYLYVCSLARLGDVEVPKERG